jgi:hypothetical protein
MDPVKLKVIALRECENPRSACCGCEGLAAIAEASTGLSTIG